MRGIAYVLQRLGNSWNRVACRRCYDGGMCQRVTCPRCGKASWVGCGQHVEQVLVGVAARDRCQCPRPTPGKGWLAKLFGR